ncbi:MAG: small multi-drug export protein [Lachnospiraceae bacterium]|nr:small multi-drug export protein [Lachnospiraceae bacterium]
MLHYILIFLISMVPLIELRGAIPYAVGFIKGGAELSLPMCYVVAIIGNMLPVPVIFFFARKVLVWGQGLERVRTITDENGNVTEKKRLIAGTFSRFCDFCMKKGEKGGRKLMEKAKGGVYVALLLFVGIPVPGTGAWTGTLAASILDLDFKKSVVAVMAGVVLAGIIMGLLSAGLFGAIFAGT